MCQLCTEMIGFVASRRLGSIESDEYEAGHSLVCADAAVFSAAAGSVGGGQPLAPYLEWPPTTRAVVHAPFSWTVFLGFLLLISAALGPFVLRIWRTTPRERSIPVVAFPWWGWGAAVWTLILWGLAWSRFEWMQPFQAHTFFPLWLGAIVLVNALTFRLVGRCMLVDRPRYFLALFPLSAGFWWFFEYLNRFVQNWYYLGGGELSAGAYVLQATLPFSTVLPAVLGTAEWLTSYPRCTAGLDRFVRIPFLRGKSWGWVMLCGAAAGLAGIGLWPDYLFPWVWVAPLLTITSLQVLGGEPTIFNEAVQGDWRRVWIVALAALLCGLFWETWNFYSLAHWEYAVPFVQGITLFHMPLLGYAGYLPFGLECLAVAELCLARTFAGGVAYYRVPTGDVDLAQRKPTVAER